LPSVALVLFSLLLPYGGGAVFLNTVPPPPHIAKKLVMLGIARFLSLFASKKIRYTQQKTIVYAR
jgi:hypothetical protein